MGPPFRVYTPREEKPSKETHDVNRDHPNHDQLFKELLHSFLPEFLLLVAPRQAHRLKLEHGRFLDQETFADFPDGDLRRADVVYATETLDGEPELILVHIEVESRFRGDFDQRMARYGLSLFLRHKVPILPLAVFLQGGASGDSRNGREIYPRVVELDAAGFWFNRYRYLACALSRGEAEKYLTRQDPLAAALAALMPYQAGSPADHKLQCLRRILTARELSPARSFQLAHIVDTYIQLETDEEEKFRQIITDVLGKEATTMETSWDRFVAERTRHAEAIGLVLGMRRMLLRLLESRFGDLPEPVLQTVEDCQDPEQLERWSEAVLTAPDLGAMGLA